MAVWGYCGSSCTGACPPACCPGSSWESRVYCSPWTKEGTVPVLPWCPFTCWTHQMVLNTEEWELIRTSTKLFLGRDILYVILFLCKLLYQLKKCELAFVIIWLKTALFDWPFSTWTMILKPCHTTTFIPSSVYTFVQCWTKDSYVSISCDVSLRGDLQSSTFSQATKINSFWRPRFKSQFFLCWFSRNLIYFKTIKDKNTHVNMK